MPTPAKLLLLWALVSPAVIVDGQDTVETASQLRCWIAERYLTDTADGGAGLSDMADNCAVCTKTMDCGNCPITTKIDENGNAYTSCSCFALKCESAESAQSKCGRHVEGHYDGYPECCNTDCCNGLESGETSSEGEVSCLGEKVVITEEEIPICEPGGAGLFLPLSEAEQYWPTGVRAVLYLLGLFWLFAGVAIIADIFMAGIETITSQQKPITLERDGKMSTYYVQVWNDTIANLSLMALGSSAPEILLSVIELFGNNYYSGALGPSTIVGSAAFNLLCIIAVCIVAIPDGDGRKIKQYDVFTVTAACSVFAYVWLVGILLVTSPNLVTITESALTFCFFPLLLATAYIADTQWVRNFMSEKKVNSVIQGVTASDGSQVSTEELAKITKRIRQQYGANLTDDELSHLVSEEASKQVPKSRAYYRINATRQMTGGKKVIADNSKGAGYNKLDAPISMSTKKAALGPYFEFEALTYSVLESGGTVTVKVVRGPDPTKNKPYGYRTSVALRTLDGTATAPSDYVPIERQVLEFAPNEKFKEIEITIVDDFDYEDDEDFYCEIFDCGDGMEIGENSKTTVTIVNDDFPGQFKIPEEEISVYESELQVSVPIERVEGCSGRVSVEYRTRDDTATAGADYKPISGTLVFEHGETKKNITVEIINDDNYEKDEIFLVVLANPTGGSKFQYDEEKLVIPVTIINDDELRNNLDRIYDKIHVNSDKLALGTSNYKEQFINAFTVGGGDDENEDSGPPSAMDKIAHCFTLPWKVLFAFVPPTDFMGGWLCFSCALTMVGVVTAVIGDMASLLGCVVGMPDALTAITLVALGTSLPDTFASKAAACGDPYADNSVGNVTGSNSVNVFLGLGLPWTLGALYWSSQGATDEWIERYPDLYKQYPGGGFAVPAGSLGSSVAIFVFCCCCCIGLLVYRRKKFGMELGGPVGPKKTHAAFLVGLWLFYLAVSAKLIFDEIAEQGGSR